MIFSIQAGLSLSERTPEHLAAYFEEIALGYVWRINAKPGLGRVIESYILPVVMNLRGGTIRGGCDGTTPFAATDDLGGEVVDCHSCRLALLYFPLCRLRLITAHSLRFVTSDPPLPDG
jgi:hypothetical protein